MPKFMSSHQFPPGAFDREQVCQIAEAAQQAPDVRGYRSFLNLSEGKVFCVFEAPDRESVAAWYEKMELPYDDITLVELEGDRGEIHDAQAVAPARST